MKLSIISFARISYLLTSLEWVFAYRKFFKTVDFHFVHAMNKPWTKRKQILCTKNVHACQEGMSEVSTEKTEAGRIIHLINL